MSDNKKSKNTKRAEVIRRTFTMAPEQGAAALLVGSRAEGRPLVSMTRRGNRVEAIYARSS